VQGGTGVPYPTAPKGSPLNKLFDGVNPNQGQGDTAQQDSESLGSGFVVSADGLIVTNNHVIDGADDIEVYLPDGTRLSAKVVGTDQKVDLALLKIEAGHPLKFVEFGDSDTAQVGDWVMAIGNPFGLGGSVTLGIVSARNRDIESGPYDSFIQTDASINQGNSGGPLFDMNGKVVGINTAIVARGGASLGIGFAVAANLAKPVIDQLREYGETRRGWLGVGIQDITDDIASSLGRKTTDGALVVDITKGGPADGLMQEGDLILSFNDKPIDRMRDLPRAVAEAAIGTAVHVKVLRSGKEQVFDIKVGRLEAGEKQIAEAQSKAAPVLPPDAPEGPIGPAPTLGDLLGVDVAPLSDASRKQYNLPGSVNGVLVTTVKPGSDAYTKGVLAGFVISEVNQQKITTVADVTTIVSGAKAAGRPAVLFKVTGPTGSSRVIAVKLE
jgi:serine protease Do